MNEAKPQARRRSRTSDKVQLTRDNWLDAAAGEIAAGGFGHLRVLTLSKKLGVTRGSFYWHFRDHEDLVVSFLDRWRDRRLHELRYWKPEGENTAEELRQILELLLTDAARNVRRLQVELAVRDFARRDAYAAKIVAEVDEARISQNCILFQHISKDPQRTRDLSLLLYVATIGSQVVLTGRSDDDNAIGRIEDLMARVVMGFKEDR
ncbi:TetR/AcrR family transcriptional regulator [Marinobacter nanhaiticus D15-8W]|uniref:TetR/AcrR family transcriptional regulator n=1 Tax=Marinobacter nanhaiticus D15-8W TaxID=626887 RepID=N6WWE9_9GAMM|nr:TetR/AcrR family transcriptional regulator [Marinobacter nanhaiticus]ENO15377.1 TetR/AcrR family transcriptional regulator [Marinobacter nanhaiticus D15-8W]BES73777.1 TetR/AcrR family transcriptional regulator [Marinobacter nanhaiticus D15-8W]